MNQSNRRPIYLAFVLVSAAVVYLVGHWQAITDKYVINDDVRQQIYWMQQWQDPELFQDDLLTRYAKNYVPWGVQAIYRIGSLFINPVQFSKILTGLLYVITAGFVFGLGLQFRDELTGVVVACVFFFFTGFIREISGGLSHSFGHPLLAAYLFFLGRNNLLAAGLVILLESVLNPYVFLLCFVTHGIFLTWHYCWDSLKALWAGSASSGALADSNPLAIASRRGTDASESLQGRDPPFKRLSPLKLLILNLPVLAGVFLIILKYVFLSPAELGTMVTWADMADKVEYTSAGRYAIIPVPSILWELTRPWIYVFPFREWGPLSGWIGIVGVAAVMIFAWTRPDKMSCLTGFRVFGYVLAASFLLYGISYLVMMRLFLPERYLEFSLTLFYCIALAVGIKIVLDSVGLRRITFPWMAALSVVIAALRTFEVGIYDYSREAHLYRFLETTPKSSLIAGHPELMDNIPTFARRKAFVTYELSHTWIDPYWNIIKKRTFDFFKAYYSGDPEEIRSLCRYYGIDYLLVRDEDFSSKTLTSGHIYFEPFKGYVRKMVKPGSRFAVLDKKAFPVIYHWDGIRVLQLNSRSPATVGSPTTP